jgi:hypothetical protein
MTPKWHIPRRTFLRGLGTAIALPMLEAMVPPLRALGAQAEAKVFPKRMAFVYVPNGMNMADWTPKAVGASFDLPYILEPLQACRNDFSIISGLALDGARAHGDGPGDHARANAAFLTGCHPRKTPGADIRAGVSVDQVAAAEIGNRTRLQSLELGCEGNRQAGECDSGYSCAYQANLSWKAEATPLPPEIDPRFVFERLFGNTVPGETFEAREKRRRYQKSILDLSLEDAKQLQKQLGRTDRRKLDEYLTAVRELEVRIEQADKFAAGLPDYKRPTGIPGGPDGFEKHIRLMFDLLALAFQTDSTRISTFLLAFDGSNRPYRSLGISEGHHELSHHGYDQAKMKRIAQINHFHATQFAYFLQKLKSIREGEGTLLDNCMIVYGSGIGDGNAHNHDNLPVLFAGRGGANLQQGRHLRLSHETPLTNLYVSMLDLMGVPAVRVGDSTGKLKELT